MSRIAERLRQLPAAKTATKTDPAKALRASIAMCLIEHGFAKPDANDLFWYVGTLRQNAAEKLNKTLLKLNLERSPATRAWSWYNRNIDILIHLGQKDDRYYAVIKQFN